MTLPTPAIQPLERLQVVDGLPINADRWRRAHAYHRQRQNLHYQALQQPGIVSGLGVRAIAAPMEVSAQFRDRRWVQVQPGVAIDLQGNPIVVPQPIEFRIASDLHPTQPLTVFLVVRYVDPESLDWRSPNEFVPESYRLDEKMALAPDDIELCRVVLPPASGDAALLPALQDAVDPLFPDVNDLDLRHRPIATVRPQATLQVAGFSNLSASQSDVQGLESLVRSLPGLYPALECHLLPTVSRSTLTPEMLAAIDLLVLSQDQFHTLDANELAQLQQAVAAGSTLLVMVMPDEPLRELLAIERELEGALAQLLTRPTNRINGQAMRSPLEQEHAAIKLDVERELHRRCAALNAVAQRLGAPLSPWVQLSPNHPLRHRPFQFAQLPAVHEQPLHLWVGGGMVVAIGDLSSAWSGHCTVPLSRDTIRAVHELGINLLHYAFSRRHLRQLQQAVL